MEFPAPMIVRRFLADEAGQDVVEYALLTALIGVAAVVTWQLLIGKVGVAYSSTESNVQDLSDFTPDPIVPE